MSKKLENVKGKVRKVMNHAKDMGFSLSEKKIENGISNSDNTYNEYRDEVIRFIDRYYEKYKVADITKFNPKLVKELFEEDVKKFREGDLQKSFSIHKTLNALDFFQKMSEKTDVFVNKKTEETGVNIFNAKVYKQELVKENVIRMSGVSSSRKADAETAKKALSMLKTGGYDVGNKDKVIDICEFASRTGSRITAALSVRKEDIDFDKNQLTFVSDKGNKTRVIDFDEDTKRFLIEIVNKSDDKELFQFRKKNGDKLSKKKSRDMINERMRNVLKPLSINKTVEYKDENGNKLETEIQQNFTFHTFRKSFSDSRVRKYIDDIQQKGGREKILEGLYEREGKEKIDKKLKVMLNKINKNKSEKNKRELNDLEICLFATSVDLGHYRLDVMTQFYVNKKDYVGLLPK